MSTTGICYARVLAECCTLQQLRKYSLSVADPVVHSLIHSFFVMVFNIYREEENIVKILVGMHARFLPVPFTVKKFVDRRHIHGG